MCLLDLPFHSHLKPKASTSLVIAFPHVATVPGPVSLPGALIVCTRLPANTPTFLPEILVLEIACSPSLIVKPKKRLSVSKL